MDYNISFFIWYVCRIVAELEKRKIKYNKNLKYEIWDFAPLNTFLTKDNYPEHNDRYLRQNLYNLEEKAMRNIISKEEWQKIYNEFKDFTDLWKGE